MKLTSEEGWEVLRKRTFSRVWPQSLAIYIFLLYFLSSFGFFTKLASLLFDLITHFLGSIVIVFMSWPLPFALVHALHEPKCDGWNFGAKMNERKKRKDILVWVKKSMRKEEGNSRRRKRKRRTEKWKNGCVLFYRIRSHVQDCLIDFCL